MAPGVAGGDASPTTGRRKTRNRHEHVVRVSGAGDPRARTEGVGPQRHRNAAAGLTEARRRARRRRAGAGVLALVSACNRGR